MNWTPDEERRIEDAVNKYKVMFREEEIDAEIERRVLKLKYGRMAGFFRVLYSLGHDCSQIENDED